MTEINEPRSSLDNFSLYWKKFEILEIRDEYFKISVLSQNNITSVQLDECFYYSGH